MSTAAKKQLPPAVDLTVYPIEDDVGEGSLQRLISELLRPLIERWLAEQGKPTFVGADQYFYWQQFAPHESVAPDVYVLPGAPLGVQVGAWLVWKTGLVPSFALEVVSDDVRKDYLRSPPRYDRLGVKELVVFDPAWETGRDRVRFQVFRRVKGRGFVRVVATNADRVRSRVLGAFLRAVGEGDEVRLRVGGGLHGDELFPTDAERADAARAARDAERAAREQAEAAREEADAARDAERAAREQAEAARDAERAARERAEAARAEAEAEIARLRAEIARRR